MKIPQTPPDLQELILSEPNLFEKISKVMGEVDCFGYPHWDDLRFRNPPGDLTHKEWWAAVKMGRMRLAHRIPLRDRTGGFFQFQVPDTVAEQLHEIDMGAGGKIGVRAPVIDGPMRDRYLMGSLMREAITSSQLEGAVTTREVAKEMIRTGRPPRNRSERMIANNFTTMKEIIELQGQPLTMDMILHIHRKVTEDALDKPDASGRLRREEEPVTVEDEYGVVFHQPPPASELKDRLREMCAFANGETPGYFVHPAVRAMLLHFWLAYDHPFVDGNGRTARALFYWAMLHHGYWLFEFVSISEILSRSPSKYYKAFLHSETDGNDATYFLVHQSEVIRQAIERLHTHIETKTKELEENSRNLRQWAQLNPRQLALLGHAARHPQSFYSIEGHQRSHNTAYDTARRDLLELHQKGLLGKSKRGRAMVFTIPDDILAKLKKSPHP